MCSLYYRNLFVQYFTISGQAGPCRLRALRSRNSDTVIRAQSFSFLGSTFLRVAFPFMQALPPIGGQLASSGSLLMSSSLELRRSRLFWWKHRAASRGLQLGYTFISEPVTVMGGSDCQRGNPPRLNHLVGEWRSGFQKKIEYLCQNKRNACCSDKDVRCPRCWLFPFPPRSTLYPSVGRRNQLV